MSGGGEETRVSIPSNVQSQIKSIREITKKQHTDDEIYAVLKEFSMDLSETIARLMYLDTFHVVERKKDRRKETKVRESEDSRMTPGTQRRAPRSGGQGNYSSSISSDAGGVRHSSARRENGAFHVADRGSMPSPVKPVQKTKNIPATLITKASTGAPNGPANLSNGSSVNGYAPKSPLEADNNVREGGSGIQIKKWGPTATRPAAVASTPVAATSASAFSGSVDPVKPMSPNQLLVAATSASASSVCSSTSDSAISIHIQENKKGSGNPVGSGLPKSVKTPSRSANSEKTPSDLRVAEKNGTIKPSQPLFSSNGNGSMVKLPSKSDKQPLLEPTVPSKVVTQEVATKSVEATSQLPPDSSVPVAKHVTFPNHIQVPEALKNVLTFGSIDATCGPRVESVTGTGGDNLSTGAVESSHDTDETAKEPSPSNDMVSSPVQGEFSENPLSLPSVLEKLPPSESSVSSSSDSKGELPKQDSQLPSEGPQNPTSLHAPGYNLGFFQPMIGSPLLQMEGHENSAHEATRLPNFAGGNPASVPSPNSTPPLPSSIPVSQQSMPVYRHPYPHSFYPFGPYLPPYFIPPMHQFLGHNGYPAPPSAGNVFLPPPPPPPSAAAAAGVKFTLPQFKAGANTGNPTQYSIQGGSFMNVPGAYPPGPTVTSGSSIGNEDLGASQLKENHMYTTGQLTEGSGLWMPGQEMPGLHSMYNHLAQGPRLAFSPMQAGHGAMAGMYPPGQTIASPTFMQQSQAVAGAAENIGAQSAAYQQPQHTINWN